MKAQTFILIVLTYLVTLSCNSDDNNTTIAEDPLNGSWNLTNVFGGFLTVDIDYAPDEVTWTFDTTNEMISIENNILTTGPEQIHSGPETGVYNYEIVVENLEEVIYIDGVFTGVLVIENNTLLIDNGLSSDGFISTYIKR
jgi:hypothetical protein